MRYLALVLLLATMPAVRAGAAPAPTPTAWPETVVEVRMTAEADPDTGRITGVEHLRWHSTSSAPVDELCFHLYLNAFANTETTFMAGSGGQLRDNRMKDNGWGWIEVDAMRLADGTDLKASERFEAVDDGNPHDRTVAFYALPEPLEPGQWIELEIEFTSQLPSPFARTGYLKGFIMAGQWFPKIAVLEDRGVRGRDEPGWNAHQYHPYGEFYADFGTFDVTLSLPEQYQGKVGATGHLVDEWVEDGRVHSHFVLEGAHDFAWTADPRFVVVEERFDPVADVPPEMTEHFATLLDLPEAELALQPVLIRFLGQPDKKAMIPLHLEAAKATLRGLGLRLGAYPYPTLTIVDPPLGAEGVRGMEYPTMVATEGRARSSLPGLRDMKWAVTTTIHEIGHQYFQSMVASDEVEEPWIDEGLTSYYEMVVADELYGRPYRIFGLAVDTEESSHAAIAFTNPYLDPIVKPCWAFASNGSYNMSSYMRPALTFRHLERLLGEARFDRAMRRTFQAWRWHHPSTDDLLATISEASNEDLSWFFDQTMRTDQALDYRLDRARSTPVTPFEGYTWIDGKRTLITADESDSDDSSGNSSGDSSDDSSDDSPGDDSSAEPEDSATEDSATEDGTGDSVEPIAAEPIAAEPGAAEPGAAEPGVGEPEDEYETVVMVRRIGGIRHPVEVELRFDDGSSTRLAWDGADRWKRWRLRTEHKVVEAELDPDHVMVLDVNRLDNSLRAEPAPAASSKILTHFIFWLQNLLAASDILG